MTGLPVSPTTMMLGARAEVEGRIPGSREENFGVLAGVAPHGALALSSSESLSLALLLSNSCSVTIGANDNLVVRRLPAVLGVAMADASGACDCVASNVCRERVMRRVRPSSPPASDATDESRQDESIESSCLDDDDDVDVSIVEVESSVSARPRRRGLDTVAETDAVRAVLLRDLVAVREAPDVTDLDFSERIAVRGASIRLCGI